MSAETIASEIDIAIRTGAAVSPYSQRASGLAIEDAYAVTAALRSLHRDRGETPVGRKIGFTNRAIWSQYNVSSPIWGDMYDHTVHDIGRLAGRYTLEAWPEPQIEPEIVVKFRDTPSPEMDERALLDSIAWVALGFEIVQSPFPGWRFAAADCIAAGGLHGALLVGEPTAVEPRAGVDWIEALANFELDLHCGDRTVDHGVGANVLGSPLAALRHLMTILAKDRFNSPLAAGEIITTGTVTRAFPIARGETWSVRLAGLPLAPIAVTFS